MLYLQSEDSKADIHFYINSPGGSVSAGLAIYDTMQFVNCDVATYCIGQAASMGAVLLTAGAQGKRFALPNARIMIHQPLAGMQGSAEEIMIHAKEFRRIKDRMNEILIRHTGHPLEKIEKDTDRDCFMTAEEACEYHLIDKVVSQMEKCSPRPSPRAWREAAGQALVQGRTRSSHGTSDRTTRAGARVRTRVRDSLQHESRGDKEVTAREDAMSVRLLLTAGLATLLLGGCRNDPHMQLYIDNVNAEKRLLEDTLYDLQYDYECKIAGSRETPQRTDPTQVRGRRPAEPAAPVRAAAGSRMHPPGPATICSRTFPT